MIKQLILNQVLKQYLAPIYNMVEKYDYELDEEATGEEKVLHQTASWGKLITFGIIAVWVFAVVLILIGSLPNIILITIPAVGLLWLADIIISDMLDSQARKLDYINFAEYLGDLED